MGVLEKGERALLELDIKTEQGWVCDLVGYNWVAGFVMPDPPSLVSDPEGTPIDYVLKGPDASVLCQGGFRVYIRQEHPDEIHVTVTRNVMEEIGSVHHPFQGGFLW